MSGMFWIALEMSNSEMGLITRLSLPVKKIVAFKNCATDLAIVGATPRDTLDRAVGLPNWCLPYSPRICVCLFTVGAEIIYLRSYFVPRLFI